MNQIGEQWKSNIFFQTKPACFAPLPPDTNLGANMLTLNSLRSELLHDTNLETCEPRSYYTNSKLDSLGAIT